MHKMVSQLRFVPGKERDVIRQLLTWGLMEKSCLLKDHHTLTSGLAPTLTPRFLYFS